MHDRVATEAERATMGVPVQFARPLPNSRGWRPRLTVKANILTGTICVAFDADRGLAYNKELILTYMRRVNRRTPDGYGIQLNFREAWSFERVYSFDPILYVRVVSSMLDTRCSGAAACYEPSWNTILLTSQAHDYIIVHELFHKLGLGHSGSPLSVMYWSQGGRPHLDTTTYDAEVRALVGAYR